MRTLHMDELSVENKSNKLWFHKLNVNFSQIKYVSLKFNKCEKITLRALKESIHMSFFFFVTPENILSFKIRN